MDLQNKIDSLDEQQQAKLAKYISKLEKEKQLAKRQRQLAKTKLTKIVSSMNKAYESFNVDIINYKDPQVQLHQSKELDKDFLTG